MKIAAIYDIHGNLPALEAVLKEIEQVQPDRILVGGDIVSGPMPKEVLERLLAMGTGYIAFGATRTAKWLLHLTVYRSIQIYPMRCES